MRVRALVPFTNSAGLQVGTGNDADVTDAYGAALIAAGLAVAAQEGNLLEVGEEVFSRDLVDSNSVTAPASGDLRLVYFTARKTETITQVRHRTGSTAGATLTLVRFGVYAEDPTTKDLTLVASTPNDTTLLTASTTVYTKALSASFVKTRGTRYAVALLITGTTMPNAWGASFVSTQTIVEETPRLVGRVVSQTDLPASILAATPTSVALRPYFELLP